MIHPDEMLAAWEADEVVDSMEELIIFEQTQPSILQPVEITLDDDLEDKLALDAETEHSPPRLAEPSALPSSSADAALPSSSAPSPSTPASLGHPSASVSRSAHDVSLETSVETSENTMTEVCQSAPPVPAPAPAPVVSAPANESFDAVDAAASVGINAKVETLAACSGALAIAGDVAGSSPASSPALAPAPVPVPVVSAPANESFDAVDAAASVGLNAKVETLAACSGALAIAGDVAGSSPASSPPSIDGSDNHHAEEAAMETALPALDALEIS